MSETLDFRSDAEMHEHAASLNCEVVTADDTTLLLDLDGPAALALFQSQLARAVVNKILPSKDHEIWPSRSKGHHVRITLPEPLPVLERIGMQSFLGSDPIRDLLSYSRVKRGVPNPILLFRPLAPAIVTENADGPLPF